MNMTYLEKALAPNNSMVAGEQAVNQGQRIELEKWVHSLLFFFFRTFKLDLIVKAKESAFVGTMLHLDHVTYAEHYLDSSSERILIFSKKGIKKWGKHEKKLLIVQLAMPNIKERATYLICVFRT